MTARKVMCQSSKLKDDSFKTQYFAILHVSMHLWELCGFLCCWWSGVKGICCKGECYQPSWKQKLLIRVCKKYKSITVFHSCVNVSCRGNISHPMKLSQFVITYWILKSVQFFFSPLLPNLHKFYSMVFQMSSIIVKWKFRCTVSQSFIPIKTFWLSHTTPLFLR